MVGTQSSLIKKKLTIKEEARRPANLAEGKNQTNNQIYIIWGWQWRYAGIGGSSLPPSLLFPFEFLLEIQTGAVFAPTKDFG